MAHEAIRVFEEPIAINAYQETSVIAKCGKR